MDCPIYLNHDALHRALLLTDLLTGRKLPVMLGRADAMNPVLREDLLFAGRYSVEAGSPGGARDRVHLLVSLPLLNEDGQPEDPRPRTVPGALVTVNGLLSMLAKHPSTSPPRPVEVVSTPDGGVAFTLDAGSNAGERAHAFPAKGKADHVCFPARRDWTCVTEIHVAAEEVYVDGYPDGAEGDGNESAAFRKRLPGTVFLAMHALQAARPESVQVRRFVAAGRGSRVVYTGLGLDFWVSISVPLMGGGK